MGDSYRDLIVWQRAIQLTLDVYKLTAAFPESEKFGLINQLHQASVSVASNIARDTASPRRVNTDCFSDTHEGPILKSPRSL